MGLYEGILGVRAEYEGLKVEPCFPSCWESTEMTRHFRGADYHVVMKNPLGIENGEAQVTVDGTRLSGTVLPDFGDGGLHEVEVVLMERKV